MPTQNQPDELNTNEGASLWRSEAFGGLEMIRAHYVDFSFSPHTHSEYMIAVTENGLGTPHFRGKRHQVGAGDILVLNPEEVHGGGPARDTIWRYRAFYAPVALMQLVTRELESEHPAAPGFTKDVISAPQLAVKLHRVHAALEAPQSALQSESLLLEALAGLVEHYAAEGQTWRQVGNEHRSVKRAREYLEALPGENVSLETLAQEAGLSPYYFCRVFRKHTGLTPHGYQLLVRVRFAKRLLMKGTPIAQAALEAGFFDQPHFTKHFKRIFGVPPSDFFPHDLPRDVRGR